MSFIERVKIIKKEVYKFKKEYLKNSILELLEEDKTLEDIIKLHSFLIENIIEIHNEEEDFHNRRILEENINISNCIHDFNNCRRAYNTYILNKVKEVYFIGDIHSDSISIKRILSKVNFFNKIEKKEDFALLFLGDYVDRGENHLKTIEILLILKYLFPENIFLLRGNHDGGYLEEEIYKLIVGRNSNTTDRDYFISYIYNLLKENSLELDLLKCYIDFFHSLSINAFVKSEKHVYMGVHGGLPRPLDNETFYSHIKSLRDLTNENIVDLINRTIVQNLLWSDPKEGDIEETKNKGRFYFYKEHFNSFRKRFGIYKVIRGHEAYEEGYKEFFEGKLLCIFSSGRLTDAMGNQVNHETNYRNISPKIIRLYKDKEEIIAL
ncbi:metallophosphoesterase family protein [Clostridium hydrogeniformans]|uniref:metallophosphoesterase family protein n=1 Tax=Clostridium hydrogeniformans TaxID=349933 RepID=UPI000489E3E9|nr:metallophosphoesterase family protein [Clostridium hydrogeniformans]